MLYQHRSSKRPVAFLIALVLGAVAAATAQYVEPTFYGEPTYYEPIAPVYYSPEPVPVYGTPAPYYYPSPVPTFPYGEPVAPAPYYYIPPAAPTTPYGEPVAPAPYYYIPPTAPTTPYGEPVAPTPYYYVPPVAPTTPYGEPVAPTPYYYVPTAPTTPYGPAAPTVYYTAPVAPVTPYGAPVAPTYYYVAPAPVTPYAAPSTCPPCPTCDTTSSSSSYASPPATSKLAIAPTTSTASSAEGTCYCPYDSDWAAWAIGDSSCRSTLYSKCKTDARLSCSWLDSYFDSNATHHEDFTRENEANIEAYLYNDCPPAAPCTCAALEFTSKDSPASTFQCCKALKIYAKVPYSGLVSKDVDAYCESGSAKAAARVAGWVKHALWHADCSVAYSSVYTYKKAGDSTASTASSSSAAAPKSRAVESDKRSTILAATFGALGGVGLAAAAAAGWVAYKKSNSRYSMV